MSHGEEMKFCALGSGSKGNCIYVSDGETSILVDAGLSFSILKERLEKACIPLESLQAVLFTHDHSDHYRGVAGLLRANPSIELYANEGTAEGIELGFPNTCLQWQIFERTTPFTIRSMTITPFPVPHNAADPVGFTIKSNGRTLGIVTDLGHIMPNLRESLADCNALILESNYDPAMLKSSNRPFSVRSRIAGVRGHLSNEDAAEFIRYAGLILLQSLHLAHISEECNTTYDAHRSMSQALWECGLGDITLTCFCQNEPSCMYEV
jgi:phosphoribosyl 1,2-cyclic phosphodiesterase